MGTPATGVESEEGKDQEASRPADGAPAGNGNAAGGNGGGGNGGGGAAKDEHDPENPTGAKRAKSIIIKNFSNASLTIEYGESVVNLRPNETKTIVVGNLKTPVLTVFKTGYGKVGNVTPSFGENNTAIVELGGSR